MSLVLFPYTVSRSVYVQPNDTVIGEYRLGKYVEGSGCAVILGNILSFVWRYL